MNLMIDFAIVLLVIAGVYAYFRRAKRRDSEQMTARETERLAGGLPKSTWTTDQDRIELQRCRAAWRLATVPDPVARSTE